MGWHRSRGGRIRLARSRCPGRGDKRRVSRPNDFQSAIPETTMTIKVAINGYGRIGRNILRAHYEDGKKHDLAIVALNDLGSPETNAHLTRYDTVHGKFPGKVDVEGDALIVNGDRIKVFAQRDPGQLPWAELGVDLVLECTG